MHPEFIIAPPEVYIDHRLTLIETRVLLVLYSFRNKNTELCCPHRETICERAGYGPAPVSRALTKLVKKGWVTRQQTRGPNFLSLHVPDLETVTDPVTVTSLDVNSDRSVPINSDRSGTETVTDPVTPKQTINRQRLTEEETPIVPLKGDAPSSISFDQFWSAYPKKVGKAPAERAWKKINGSGPAILADLAKRPTQDPQWLEGFVPNPATYLNQQRWEDEWAAAPAKPAKKTTADRLREYDAAIRQNHGLPPDPRDMSPGDPRDMGQAERVED